MKVTGHCHCKRVKFEVQSQLRKIIRCNCSICEMKGFVHLIVPKEDFTLLSGEEFLSTYRFNTKQARHIFCSHCGVQSFYYPRSHPDGVSVNFVCLEDHQKYNPEITHFDGQNWEEARSSLDKDHKSRA